MLDTKIKEIIQELISLVAISFKDIPDNTILFDSTWFCGNLPLSAAHKNKINARKVSLPPHSKTRKLHALC